MNTINVDTLSWTALTKYPLQEHWQHITRHTNIATPDQAHGTTGKTKKEETSPDHSLHTADSAGQAVMTCTEATSDQSNETDTAIIEAAQDSPIQHTRDMATDPTVTHCTGHTAHLPHTAALQTTTLKITVDQITAHQATTLKIAVVYTYYHPTNHQSIDHTKKDHTAQYHIPTTETASPM